MEAITYEEFTHAELVSGIVVKAEPFPRAKKAAYKIWVDFGPKVGTKQTSAQITRHYTPEALIGRLVIGCINLTPKNIAGFTSEFLLVGFADEQGNIRLATADTKIPKGQKFFQ